MRSFRNERVTAMRSLPTRGGSVQSSIYLSTCLPAHLLTYSRKSIRAICPVCAVLRVSPCSTRSLARREYRDVISRNYINGYGRYCRWINPSRGRERRDSRVPIGRTRIILESNWIKYGSAESSKIKYVNVDVRYWTRGQNERKTFYEERNAAGETDRVEH